MAKQKIKFRIIEGAPEWLVTFGDMMSLLLTFFILLFSVAESKDPGLVFDVVQTYKGRFQTTKPVYGFTLPRMEVDSTGMMNDIVDEPADTGSPGASPVKVLNSEGESIHARTVRDNLFLQMGGSVHFKEGESYLLEEGRRVLKDQVLPGLVDARFKVVVTGHAAPGEVEAGPDSRAEAEYRLGFERARAVQSYLINNGIEAPRIEVQSAGARIQIGDENTENLRRRVDVLISPQVVGPPAEG